MPIDRSSVTVRRNLDKFGYGVVRSVQYISITLDPDTTSDQGSPGVAFTDFNKVVLIPAVGPSSLIAGNAGALPNIRAAVLSNTNITIFHGAVNGTDNGTAVWAGWAVELY